MTIQTKATEQYFLVVLFIMLYEVAETFESVDETQRCDHSNESYSVYTSRHFIRQIHQLTHRLDLSFVLVTHASLLSFFTPGSTNCMFIAS